MGSVILIVDDVEINRDILSVLFEDKYETITACDGEEAIEILKERSRDILLMFLDLVMPKKVELKCLSICQKNI